MLCPICLSRFRHSLDLLSRLFSFGTLNGISSLCAAIIGLLNYPLQLLALRPGFALSFIPIACAVVASALFPVFLKKRSVST